MGLCDEDCKKESDCEECNAWICADCRNSFNNCHTTSGAFVGRLFWLHAAKEAAGAIPMNTLTPNELDGLIILGQTIAENDMEITN